MSSCFDRADVAAVICAAAFGLLLLSTMFGYECEGMPRSQLGKRPMGTNAFSWCYHYYRDGVGVLGFDPSLGSYSPPLRLMMHLAATMILWSALIKMWPALGIGEKCDGPLQVLDVFQPGVAALVIYLQVQFIVSYLLPGVSDPGGPRPRIGKQRRTPKWNNATFDTPSSAKDWKCVVEEESFRASRAVFKGTSVTLIGDPAGRHIWTTCSTPEDDASMQVDQELVQELASGGRSPGFNPSTNPNSCDVHFREQQIRSYLSRGNDPPDVSRPKTVEETLQKAGHYFSMLQTEGGHWSGDYGGPLFLVPGLMIVWYIMGRPSMMLDSEATELMKHFILAHQQSDGGWGTHIESASTMLGTTLNYVALRLLMVPASHPAVVKGRDFIQEHGGAVMTTSWAKFYFCVLGVMDWKGHNSIPPEMFLLPNFFPFHPGRMWIHARILYLPMAYLYSKRFCYAHAEMDPIILSLRKELYCESYESIHWEKTRHWVADIDNFSPLPWIMRLAQNGLACYENWSIFQPIKNFLRANFANNFCVDYMKAEDLQTNFVAGAAVNKVLNMLSAFDYTGQDTNHPLLINHMARVFDYLWIAEDGMKMGGYNGSQSWDTCLAVQAYCEAGLLDEFPEMSRKAWSFIERSQVFSTESSRASPAYEFESPENRQKYFRHISKGGWSFSTTGEGYVTSDCTACGVLGLLSLLQCKAVPEALRQQELKTISQQRFEDAINILLMYQNEDGGWSTYENNRGYGWYELLNPSEAFGDIMIDYSYVECSSSCITALHEFQEVYPDFRCKEIQHAMKKGRAFLKNIQRKDGSWYGSWGPCFVYATWLGIEGLVRSGESLESPSIQKACQFMLDHQNPNGGWGEDLTSCYDRQYAKNGMEAYGDDGSSHVMTAWALLALSYAKCPNKEAIQRGVQYIIRRQLPSGDWSQEGIYGITNRTLGITYANYRNIFPIWALGRCRAVYSDSMLNSNNDDDDHTDSTEESCVTTSETTAPPLDY